MGVWVYVGVCMFQFSHRLTYEFLSMCLYLQGPDGPIDYRSFVTSDWNEYLKRMSECENPEWADGVIVMAMAHMLKRDILVVTSSPQGTDESAIQWIPGVENFKGTPIRLGHVWELHYESLGMSKLYLPTIVKL